MKTKTPNTNSWRNWPLGLAARTSTLTGARICAILTLLLLGLGLLSNTASANIKAFQSAVAAAPELTHQYTFEGPSAASQLLDKKGTANLTPFASQNWNPPATTNFTTGRDPASMAALIINSGPGGYGGADGHCLLGSVWFGTNFSYEIVFRCDEHPTTTTGTAGIANMGWLLSTRSAIDSNRRGYLLWQGQVGTTTGDGTGLGSVMGNGAGAPANGNRVADSLIVGHWYYVAGAYVTDVGTTTTTWTNYFADLTAGDTTLTAVGHANPVGSVAPYDEQVQLGVGGRYDGYQNVNPCGIDEVNIYSSNALSHATFQAHYDALRAAQNFCLNPGFEDGVDPDAPPWSFWEGTGGAQANPLVDTNNPSARVLFNTGGTRHVAAQNNLNLILDSTTNVPYHFQAQFYVPANPPNIVSRAMFRFHTDAPGVAGDPIVLDDQTTDPANLIAPGGWVTIKADWTNNTPNYFAQYLSFRQYGHTNTSNARISPPPDVYIDNCVMSSDYYRNDLNGLVKDNFGVPVAGATVVLGGTVSPTIATNITGADGRYSFSTWVPFYNTFTVNATLGAYASDGAKSQIVGSGNGSFPDITMTAPNITVSGTVKQTDGTPVEAAVTVTAGTYVSAPAVATGGNFSFSPLPSVPSYTIRATKVGFAPNPATVVITDPSQPVHIVMNPDSNFNTNLVFSLDASTLSAGNITTPIVNAGAAGGYWTPENGSPVVGTVGGLPAVTFNSAPDLFLTTDGTTQQNAPMSLINLSPDTVKYTVSAWIYRQASGGGEAYLSWSPYQHGTCFQYIGGNGTAVDNWTAGGYINYNPAPNRAEWHYVVVTYNGTSAQLYVDGALQGSQSTAFACDNIAANYPVRIGCGQQAASFSTYDTINPIRRFGGSISKLAVYDVAQTGAEIGTTWTNNSQPIIASATAGGTVSPAGTTRVPTGSAKTFTITPAPGYFIQNVLVDGSSAGTPSTYTFTSVVSPRTIAVTFQALPAQLVSGNVGNGVAGIPGATVYFSPSPNASVNPLFTTTTLASPAGNYSFNLPVGTWYACASATGYAPSADITLTVAGAPIPGQNITLAANGRNIPDQNQLLFAVLATNCPGTAPWPAFMPKGRSLSVMGTPTVSTIGSAQWENNKADGDGFTFTNVGWSPVKGTLTFNGGTIVAVATPYTGLGANAYQQFVSVLLNQFSIGVQRDTGQLRVWRGGTQFTGPIIPYGQATVFSVVVQPTGEFTVYANNAQVMNETSTFNFTTLTPNDYYMTDVNVGKGWNGDPWSSFNGDIGDVFVYKTALSDVNRKALEKDLAATFGITLAPDYNWAGPNNGNWSNPLNWNSAVPSFGNVAVFSDSSSAGATVQVDSPVTINGVQFNNLVPNTVIASTSGNTLTLDNGTATDLAPLITAAGAHTISANLAAAVGLNKTGAGKLTLSGAVQLDSAGIATANPKLVVSGAGSELVIAGTTTNAAGTATGTRVTGNGKLTITGTLITGGNDQIIADGGTPGQVVLSGTGSWTVTGGGVFVVGNNGPTCVGTVTINDNAVLDLTANGPLNIAVGWSGGSSGIVVQNGGTVRTKATGTAWAAPGGSPTLVMGNWTVDPCNAEYDLNGGTLITANIYNVYEPGTILLPPPAGSSVFKFNGGVLQGTQNDNLGDAAVVAEGSTNLMGNLTHAYVGSGGAKIDTATFNCGINQALEHDPALGITLDGGLTKLGLGTLALYKSSTYTGPTKVQAGVLECAIASSVGGGALDISTTGGAKLQLDYVGTVGVSQLTFDGGASQATGTWGSTDSGATHIDNTHFAGTGTVTVGPPPAPVLPPGGFILVSGVPRFTFSTTAGYRYQVVYKNALTDATWQVVPPGLVLATGPSMTVDDTTAAGHPARFYRIEAF